MKSVYLAWQDVNRSRRWYTIGRLDSDYKHGRPSYAFRYTRGALAAQRDAGLEPLLSFPRLHEEYNSEELFPLFKNRLITSARKDLQVYLKEMQLDEANDPLAVLALTEGRKQTDNLEIFPQIAAASDNSFRCRFFLHGWRHVNETARRALDILEIGAKLQIAIELNNPATGLAIQLQTRHEYHMIGWAPRYLINDVMRAAQENFTSMRAVLCHKIPGDTPLPQRFMVELSGVWPAGYTPMSGDEFQVLTD